MHWRMSEMTENLYLSNFQIANYLNRIVNADNGLLKLNLSKNFVMYISYIRRINYASLLGMTINMTICNDSEIITATVFQCFTAVDTPDIAKIHIVKNRHYYTSP